MVERQLRGRGIVDETVLRVMGALPRELFVEPTEVRDAYLDSALPIASGQALSQPYMVALMSELLEPRPGMRILEIGTGSGYQAAVLAAAGCDVISVERHRGLAEAARRTLADPSLELASPGLSGRIRIETGDGSLGLPEWAPYDGIVVTAAAPRVPESLRRQLVDGGHIVIPIGPMRRQVLTRVIRAGDAFEARGFGDCVFVPLIGAEGYAEDQAEGSTA